MKKLKSLYLLIALSLLLQNVILAQREYPDYYTPSGQNTRSIKAYPAPLLAINGEYGIWYKEGFKNTDDKARITRPFIICVIVRVRKFLILKLKTYQYEKNV
jgi:hypothetical protein